MSESARIGCLVMAAGNSLRFGENKLAAELDGKSLIRHALEAVPAELFSVVTVVTQYEEVEKLAAEFGFTCIRNAHPDWGISHTVELGTKAMYDCDAILYMVSDQPLLSERSVAKVVEKWKSNTNSIVGAAHSGKRGNPNIFPHAFFDELLQLQEDRGGNAVIRAHEQQLMLVEVGQQELTDCDTPQALQELKKSAGVR